MTKENFKPKEENSEYAREAARIEELRKKEHPTPEEREECMQLQLEHIKKYVIRPKRPNNWPKTYRNQWTVKVWNNGWGKANYHSKQALAMQEGATRRTKPLQSSNQEQFTKFNSSPLER